MSITTLIIFAKQLFLLLTIGASAWSVGVSIWNWEFKTISRIAAMALLSSLAAFAYIAYLPAELNRDQLLPLITIGLLLEFEVASLLLVTPKQQSGSQLIGSIILVSNTIINLIFVLGGIRFQIFG